MGKTKKTQSEWSWFLTGAALSLALYLGGHLLLASLLVRGAMGEGSAFPVTAALCLMTSAAGALLPVRRSTALGALPAGRLSAAVFCGLLIAGGALWWDGITWTGRGGFLLLCALGGGLLAALAGNRGRKRKKRRR